VDKGVGAEQLEQDSWERSAGTGQPGWDSRYRTAWQDSCIEQLGQDSRDNTAGTGHPGQQIQLRPHNWDGTTVPVEREHLGHDIWDMTSGTGPLRQDSWDRTPGTGQSG
jgi:hypothetical protein